uniref:Vitellogenin-2-like n=1 Tax=Strongyloides papillosus TaxID=174720 RepID=A0A0N5C029_STREA
MGLVQSSTMRAAKFSGSGNSKRSIRNERQPVVRSSRKYRSSSTSYNINRNAKEFSRFWKSGGHVAPKIRTTSTSSSIKSNRGKEVWKRKRQYSTDIPFTRKNSQYSYSSGESYNTEVLNGKLKPCEIGRKVYSNRSSLKTSSCDNTYGIQNDIKVKRNEFKKVSSASLPHDREITNVPMNLCYKFDDLKV